MSLLDRTLRGNLGSPSGTSDVTLSTLAYSNARLPTAYNGNAENALNYIMATLYPNYIATVANPAALPVSANPNDYYIVSDDGDGKSAGYVWVVRDNAGGFEKKYDVDWSYEGIYAETINRTQYMYASKLGMSDRDASGAIITGLYAGQRIYGGDATTQNLTFNANSFDGTGYVQTDNHFRGTADNSIDLGTSAIKFRTGYFGTTVLAGTLTIGSGSITDTSGAISFDNENLTTTGSVTGGSLITGTLTLGSGSITDSSGAISFSNENLTTTGTLAAGTTTIATTLVLASGSITDTTGAISFSNENLTTTGTLGAGNATFTRTDTDNLRLDGNTLSVLNVNGSLNLLANGTGVVNLQSAATTLDVTATGNVSATGFVQGGNLQLNSNTIAAVDTNGYIEIAPDGTGLIFVNSSIHPNSDASFSLGEAAARYLDLFLSGGISNGTTTISNATLQTLRDINVGVASGMSLFYNGTKWVASAPDTEITHNTLSGLTTGDAGHTQFVVLAGRSGGQTVQGGTGASENLVLESTANVTKGLVLTKDVFAPFTTASYSGGWAGTDIGGTSNIFRDVYTKGEFLGFRMQNVSANPSNSSQNIGRAVFNTTAGAAYVDTGTTWVEMGDTTEKFSSDTVWNGSDTTKDVTVSATISDARTALWQLLDNSNDFERIYTNIRAISATQVRITVSPALPAASYRLVGFN